ncbi:hypothetical protein HDV00_009905 [Rhizophlyctis rosea]|nr:hypothetical protein HDV00_009905 [Rhizophlyctis rosea]
MKFTTFLATLALTSAALVSAAPAAADESNNAITIAFPGATADQIKSYKAKIEAALASGSGKDKRDLEKRCYLYCAPGTPYCWCINPL